MKNKTIWIALLITAGAIASLFTYPKKEIASGKTNPTPPPKSVDTQSPLAPMGPTSTLQIKSPAVPAKQGQKPAFKYSEPHTAEEEKRAVGLRLSFENAYGKVAPAIPLTPTEFEKLKDFLVEKSLASSSASDVAVETPGRTPEDVQAAVTFAQEQVELDIKNYFGDAKYIEIARMQEVFHHLYREQNQLEPQLARAGIPALDPAQTLRLANIMGDMLGRGIRSVPPTSRDPSTGLTDLDLNVLSQASDFLSPQQLSVLQSVLVARHK